MAKNKIRISSKNLTYEQRKAIEYLLDQRMPIISIAYILKRSKNTLYFEVNKNGGARKYNAQKAQEKAEFTNDPKENDINEINDI